MRICAIVSKGESINNRIFMSIVYLNMVDTLIISMIADEIPR